MDFSNAVLVVCFHTELCLAVHDTWMHWHTHSIHSDKVTLAIDRLWLDIVDTQPPMPIIDFPAVSHHCLLQNVWMSVSVSQSWGLLRKIHTVTTDQRTSQSAWWVQSALFQRRGHLFTRSRKKKKKKDWNFYYTVEKSVWFPEYLSGDVGQKKCDNKWIQSQSQNTLIPRTL